MGKKSRKSKSGGAKPAAAARSLPNIDVGAIDNTVCGVCGTHINLNYWDEKESLVTTCCGASVCRKCNIQQNDQREETSERLKDLTVDSAIKKDPPDSQLPLMFQIYKHINAPCSMCGMALPKTEKEHHTRLVRLAEAGHARSQVRMNE